MMKIKQQDSIKDCGLSVIQALIKMFHNKNITQTELKLHAQYTENGINLENLIELAKKYSIKLSPYEVSSNDLFNNQINQYFIALVLTNDQPHYVLIKMKENYVEINDPLNGKSKTTKLSFEKIFCHVILTIDKEIWNNQKLKTQNLFNYLWLKPQLLFTNLILMILNWCFMFIASFFIKIVLDNVLPNQLTGTITKITFGFIGIAIIRLYFLWAKDWTAKKLSNFLTITLFEKFFQSLFKTNILNLNKLNANEYLHRLMIVPNTAQFLVETVYQIACNGIIMLIISITLGFISLTLFFVTVIIAVLYVIVLWLFHLKFKDLNQLHLNNQIQYFQSLFDLTLSFEDIKQPEYFEFFWKYLNQNWFKTLKTENKVWNCLNAKNLISELIGWLTPIILITIGTKLIFNEKLTIGEMLFGLSLTGHLVSACQGTLSFGLNWNVNRKNSELIKYCLDLPDEEIGFENLIDLNQVKIKNLLFNNFKFKYNKPLLDIEYWSINQNIHLEGSNGSGKTTILKIISGKFGRVEGFKINNFFLKNFNLTQYRQKICYISGQMHFPNCTVLEYITLNNRQALEKFKNNLELYNVVDFLKELKINLSTRIINHGQNFSSGQKQIISILRTLAFSYDVILLDEALENVDEKEIIILKKIIQQLQKSIFIEVSHSKRYISQGKIINIENVSLKS